MNARLVPGLACLLAACSVLPEGTSDPLDLTRRHEVEFQAEVIAGHSTLSEAVRSSTDEDLEKERVIDVRCRFVRLEEEAARGLGLLGVGAWTLGSEEVEQRLAAPAWEPLLGEVRLTMHPGQLGSVAMLNEQAYVRSFEVSAGENALMADPVVDVLSDGVLLLVEADEEGARVQLGLTLMLSDLQQLDEVEASVPGGFTPVTIQRPLVSRQRLATEATLGDGEVLLLVALEPDGAGRLVAFLDATAYEAEELLPN